MRRKLRLQFTTDGRGVEIPRGVLVKDAEGAVAYRTRKRGRFGFWAWLRWRWQCWRAGREVPQTIRVPVERVG